MDGSILRRSVLPGMVTREESASAMVTFHSRRLGKAFAFLQNLDGPEKCSV